MLSLFKYFQTRSKLFPFDTETLNTEYEVCITLASHYNLKILNNLLHRDHLIPYYKHAIQILKNYKITLKNWSRKISQLYINASFTQPNRTFSTLKISCDKILHQKKLTQLFKNVQPQNHMQPSPNWI